MRLKNILIFSALLISMVNFSFGQQKIIGKVLNDLNQELKGAQVTVEGSNYIDYSDEEGNFEVESKVTAGKLVISFDQYKTQIIPFSFNNSTIVNVGTIILSYDIKSIKDIVVTGKGVIDLEENRQTPIAVSTLSASQIQAKAGNSDLPELLKSTPSVQNIRGGGYGDGSMFLRGFDQTNTAFLINGQPINGMEDGKMYWSNWSGVLDIANAVQIQRGLGSSKLAISSVGGTTNIVIRTIDSKKGGYASAMAGNNGFIKTTGYYSTGMNKKGWAFSAMLSHWQGNGYVDNTAGQGQTYYLSVGYKLSEKHIFNFLVTGAPQWHNAANSYKLSDYIAKGTTYNPNYDTIGNGTFYSGGRNFYHKPIANLTWDWTINNKSSLSTVLYGSIGRGGFATLVSTAGTPQYARGSYNNHNWAGLVSNYNHKVNNSLSFNLGLDARYYNGDHFRGVTDFLAASSVNATSVNNGAYAVTNSYGGYNPWNAVINPNNDQKQRLGYDYSEVINYIGGFGQVEYVYKKLSAYFQGAVSTQSHVKTDSWNYADDTKADKVSNLGYNTKLGAGYAIDENQKVFFNTGYYSRQPFHDELFNNIRASNVLRNPSVTNQTILGLELGYQLNIKKIKVNINLYNTIWGNRTLTSDNGKVDETAIFYQTQGVQQNHKGFEIEVFYSPITRLKLRGFLSAGNWQYVGSATQKAFNNDGIDITSTLPATTLNLDGVKVGGAAQTTAGAGFDFNLVKGWNVDANCNYFNSLYSNVGASPTTILLPNYFTVDFGMSYRVYTRDSKNSIQVRMNIDNVFDKLFIESASTGIATLPTQAAAAWNGVNVNNLVRFGYGRTWNVSIRYNF